MRVEVKKQPKSTIEMKVVVPNDKVKEAHNRLFKEIVKNTEIKGFRKGQAPEDMVREKTDVSKLYGDVINELLQTYYPQALKEHLIQPISNPQVEITEFDIDKDFEFTALVAVKPEIKIGDYLQEAKKVHEEKSALLRGENEERLKRGEPLQQDHIHLTADDIIEAITRVTEVEVADIIKDDEADRMMARLVDQAQSIGLSLEQYLKAQNKTGEQLRNEYGVIAEKNIKAELALAELISKENIVVSDEEIDQMVAASGDEQLQANMSDPRQRLYIKSILEKNKLISKIAHEIEGEHDHTHENTENDENSNSKQVKDEKEEK